MDHIETAILNCYGIREAEQNMVFAARLTQHGHTIRNMEDLMTLYHLIIPGLSEPPVRTLRATIPENGSHIFR